MRTNKGRAGWINTVLCGLYSSKFPLHAKSKHKLVLKKLRVSHSHYVIGMPLRSQGILLPKLVPGTLPSWPRVGMSVTCIGTKAAPVKHGGDIKKITSHSSSDMAAPCIWNLALPFSFAMISKQENFFFLPQFIAWWESCISRRKKIFQKSLEIVNKFWEAAVLF